MAEISGFHNSVAGDRRVKADFWARFLGSFIGNGVYPNPSTNLQVIANGDMTVTVKAGKAWINGVFYENTSDKVITLDVADGVLKRIDRIVASDITLERDTYSKVKKGSFASVPAAPVLQRDADAYELGLADIYIANGAVSISQANITDLRLNSNYCGIVHGLFDQVDGETLFIQFQAIFDDFMESLEGVLDENAAGNLLNLINDLVSKIGSITSLTTTEKSNLVGAINELVTGIGAKTSLTTAAKDNLVSAINEMNSNYTKQVGSGTTTGSANIYVLTLSPAPTAMVDNFCVAVKINVANTGASTLNINGLGAKPIVNSYGTAVTAGDLVLNSVYTLRYNGTSFVIQGGDVTKAEKDSWTNHPAVVATLGSLGHIKTSSVDSNGNLIFNYGRYQVDFDWANAVLTNIINKNNKMQLSNTWGTTTVSASGSFDGYGSLNQYYGIRLDTTALAGKLPKTFNLYMTDTSCEHPSIRIKNVTTGEMGAWQTSSTSGTTTATYTFTPDEVVFTSGNQLEIQFKSLASLFNPKITNAQTINYLSGKYTYTDNTFSSSSAASYYPSFYLTFYNFIPNTSGTVIKTVTPADLKKWGNVKWTQEVPTGSVVVCDVLSVPPTKLDLVPTMISNTNPSGQVISNLTGDTGYESWRVFDDGSGLFYGTVTYPAYIGYNFGSQKAVDSYTIKARSSGASSYSPKSWQFQGSNDGVSWSVLHTVTNESTWSDNEIRTYTSNNADGYQYYRLYVTAGFSTTNLSFVEFELLEGSSKLKSNIISIADISDVNITTYPTLKVRWTLSRTDTAVKPTVSVPSVTWEGSLPKDRSEEQIFYKKIGTITVTSSVASVSFTGISTDYDFLVVRGKNIFTNTGNYHLYAQFNGDAGGNYSIVGDYGGSSTWGGNNADKLFLGYLLCQTSSNLGGKFELNIDQVDAAKNKLLNVKASSLSYEFQEGAGKWANVGGRVSTILIFPQSGPTFNPGSVFELYGGKVNG